MSRPPKGGDAHHHAAPQDGATCAQNTSDLSDLLNCMSDILAELAEETTDIQGHVAPLLKNATGLGETAVGDLQRLDRHAQYLVELSRMSDGLSRVPATNSISVPALCRLVRLPSLRHRFLDRENRSRADEEAGSVSMF